MIVQADVARVGDITPRLKVAHLAEAYNVAICPHFLMELHLGLVCAVQNAHWLEYIPQLDLITQQSIRIEDGKTLAPETPGLGIEWDQGAINATSLLFGYWECHGTDFAADAAKMAADPVTQDWWTPTDPCQEPLLIARRANGGR